MVGVLQAEGTLGIADGTVGDWRMAGFAAKFSGQRLPDGWVLRLRQGQGVIGGESLQGLEMAVAEQKRTVAAGSLVRQIGWRLVGRQWIDRPGGVGAGVLGGWIADAGFGGQLS